MTSMLFCPECGSTGNKEHKTKVFCSDKCHNKARIKKLHKRLEELNEFRPYYGMKYKSVTGDPHDNWLVCSFGNSDLDGEDYSVTTDYIHASEFVGDAKLDSQLVAKLLNLFASTELTGMINLLIQELDAKQ